MELLGTEVRVGATRKKWDCFISLAGRAFAVEFDGNGHYQNPTTILSDKIKDGIALTEGYGVIRIPYWVQLTEETSLYYFGVNLGVTSDYPHGFIDAKAPLPATYCWEGLERFDKEMGRLPLNVVSYVKDSLIDKATVIPRTLVMPSIMDHYLE